MRALPRCGLSPAFASAAGVAPPAEGSAPRCIAATGAIRRICLRLGSQVRLMLEVRRFYCLNATCARRTFAQRVPELLEPWARRTRPMANAQARVGAALGGQAGAPLLFHLGMPASGATLLRLVRRLSLPTLAAAAGRRRRRLGAASWADLRHDRSRPRATPRHRAAARPAGRHAEQLAARAPHYWT